MTQTAENLAREHGIARADQDAFALRSQQRAARATAGHFAEEIMPVGRARLPTNNRAPTPRSKSSPRSRRCSAPGTVTAGNASGLNDGACALLLASAEAVDAGSLTPRARVLGMAAAGVPPRTMGIGPVPAIEQAAARLGLALDDFDLIEINEAFAAQVLA